MQIIVILILFIGAYLLDSSCCFSSSYLLAIPLAPVIGAVGSLASNLLQNSANASLNQENRDWQEDMYSKYFTPAAQIKSQKSAGMNPFISGQSVTGSSMPSAPSTHAYTFDNFAGAGVQSYQQDRLVSAQESSLRAEALSKTFNSAMQIYKEFGEEAGNEFMRMQLPQFDMQGQKNITRIVNLTLQRQEIAKERENIMKLVEGKYSDRKAASDIDLIDQQITESVARIGKMASDAKVNDATIKELAMRCAKEIAETGYYKALGGQVSALTPYLVSQALFNAANMSLGYQENAATFAGNTEVRKVQYSPKFQNSRKLSFGMNPENNAFINGVNQFTDALNLNLGIGVSGQMPSFRLSTSHAYTFTNGDYDYMK